jgi:hypothetical protein
VWFSMIGPSVKEIDIVDLYEDMKVKPVDGKSERSGRLLSTIGWLCHGHPFVCFRISMGLSNRCSAGS